MAPAVRTLTRPAVPPLLADAAAPVPAPPALPVPRPRGARDVAEARLRALAARAMEASGLQPFVKLARAYPALAQGIALPIGALLVICLVLGGPPMLVVGAYFLGCGMILARTAVKTLLDQAPAAGARQPA